MDAIAPAGSGVSLSQKQIQAELKSLEDRNEKLNKGIENEIEEITKRLKKVKDQDEEYCLLYRMDQLLGLRENEITKTKSNSFINANKSKDKKVVKLPETNPSIKKNQEPQKSYVYNYSRDTIVMLEDKKDYVSKGDYEQLRREIGNLRKELIAAQAKNSGVQLIRDTITVEKRVEVPVYIDKVVEKIVEKPIYVDKVIEKPVEKIIEKTFTKVEELLAIPPDVILFDIGKSNIKPQYNSKLNFYVTQLKKYPDLNVTLSGFTDATGSAAANKVLSEKRAAAVKAYLLARGVKESQITTEFFGADNPIAENNNSINKSQNRRVELKFNRQ